MATGGWKQLYWTKQVRVPRAAAPPAVLPEAAGPTTRERLVAALADRPRTVAQLAQTFGLSQPTVLAHVRRALRDRLIVEVEVAEEERRFAAERYYAPAVPVIRQPDRELLQSACRAVAEEVARVLAHHQGDLRAAFAMTTLAREGWRLDRLWPYVYDTIQRLALAETSGPSRPTPANAPGLAWVEELPEFDRLEAARGTEEPVWKAEPA